MFARGGFSFHPARFSAYPANLPNPIIPTLARPPANSNYSRTYEIPRGGRCTGFLVRPIPCASKSFVSPAYAKTGGYTPTKMSARTFSLSFLPIFTLGPLAFQSFAHSFIFRIQPISHPSNIFRTLAPKTGGTPPQVQPIPPFLYLLFFLFPHSPRIHKAV